VVTAIAALALGSLHGCATGAGEEDPGLMPATEGSSSGWVEPDRYAYTLLTTCGERSGLGRFRLSIESGRVVAAERLQRYSDLLPLRQMPSIGDIVAIADQAESDGADEVTVRYAPDGTPRLVSIDYVSEAIDDEACYRISDVTLT